MGAQRWHLKRRKKLILFVQKTFQSECNYTDLNDGVGNEARYGKSGADEADGEDAGPEGHLLMPR